MDQGSNFVGFSSPDRQLGISIKFKKSHRKKKKKSAKRKKKESRGKNLT